MAVFVTDLLPAQSNKRAFFLIFKEIPAYLIKLSGLKDHISKRKTKTKQKCNKTSNYA